VADDRLILALDQGTTSSRAIAFGLDGRAVASAQQPFEQRFPSPGHVTHDPEAIWSSQLAVAQEVVGRVGGAERIAAIGITNQRETTIVWDRATGVPIADAIVWQSRITAPATSHCSGSEPGCRSTPTSAGRRSRPSSTPYPALAPVPSAASWRSGPSIPSSSGA
jgi:glycerol kinase